MLIKSIFFKTHVQNPNTDNTIHLKPHRLRQCFSKILCDSTSTYEVEYVNLLHFLVTYAL